MTTLSLSPGALRLAELRRIVRGHDRITLAGDWRVGVERAVAAVRQRLEAGEALYGINTGFGRLARTRIAPDELAQLQLYIVRSHAAGVGEPLPDSTVRLVMVLKAASLARGFSGVVSAAVLVATVQFRPFQKNWEWWGRDGASRNGSKPHTKEMVCDFSPTRDFSGGFSHNSRGWRPDRRQCRRAAVRGRLEGISRNFSCSGGSSGWPSLRLTVHSILVRPLCVLGRCRAY